MMREKTVVMVGELTVGTVGRRVATGRDVGFPTLSVGPGSVSHTGHRGAPSTTTSRREPESEDPMRPWPGSAYPLGASYDGAGTNFAIFSEIAERVELCLFADDETLKEVVTELPPTVLPRGGR